MNKKYLMEQTNTSEKKLKLMVIDRLLKKDYESTGVYEKYYEELEATKEYEADYFLEFYEWLEEEYYSLDVEATEEVILENILNNHHYLD